MFCDKQKKSSTFSLAFLRTVFLPVCEFHQCLGGFAGNFE